MNIFLYIIIFIIGTFFGSFFTLAVHRIPKREDILIKHSYCPNCNHKLGFFDLFPILSYLILRGKCQYCGNKIRIRYLILEILSGITFLICAISLKVDFFNINIVLKMFFLLLYISILFIIAGIDKENRKVQKEVLIFGFIIEIIYIIYLYALGFFSVYQYVIYSLLFIILLLLVLIKSFEQQNYYIQILYLLIYILIFNGCIVNIITLLVTSILIVFYKKILNKNQKISIGFFLNVSNILVIILFNLIVNYLI